MNKFTCTIITPAGVLVDHVRIFSAVIPTSSGTIKVLPAHQATIAHVALGKVVLELEHGAKEIYTTSDGILRIEPTGITILSELADLHTDQFKQKIAEALANAKNASESLTAPAMAQLERRLRYHKFVLEMDGKEF